MLIYSFGSGFNIESTDETYINQMKETIAYANSKGIEVGGYDLICLTRSVQAEWMAIDPTTGKSFGSACFASGWYDYLLKRCVQFSLLVVTDPVILPVLPNAKSSHCFSVKYFTEAFSLLANKYIHRCKSSFQLFSSFLMADTHIYFWTFATRCLGIIIFLIIWS